MNISSIKTANFFPWSLPQTATIASSQVSEPDQPASRQNRDWDALNIAEQYDRWAKIVCPVNALVGSHFDARR
ncbi:MAG: hypothetical protein WDZ85_01885 [Candidatus Paceibacterota bacterium]